MCNEAHSIRCRLGMIEERRGQVISCFFSADRHKCVKNQRSGERSNSRTRNRKVVLDARGKRVIDDEKKEEEEGKEACRPQCAVYAWETMIFLLRSFLSFIFSRLPKLAPCMLMYVWMLVTMRCRTRSNDIHTYIYINIYFYVCRERRRRRHSLFIMWNESHSSQSFFSLSRLVTDVDAFSLSLSLPDISSS